MSEESQTHPFGNPDGSRAELDDLIGGFVDFDDESVWGGLALKDSDSSARVLVGRKGSGKTLYLRRLQAYSSNDASRYAEPIDQGVPSTENVVKFCHMYPSKILTEKWMSIWEKAIIRTLAQNLLYDNNLKSYIQSEDLKNQLLDPSYEKLLSRNRRATTCYKELKTIIQSYQSRNSMDRFLDDSAWGAIEDILKEATFNCPPIYFYLDAIDEEFAHAPMYWLRCQKGLFYQTMRFLRDHSLGGRLHVTIGIRDLVMSSVFRSEHKTRYLNEPHIKNLDWGSHSISRLLQSKIALLPDKFLMEPDAENIYERWLGCQEILNGLGLAESIENYLLRHTRLSPRDIIHVGNELCSRISKYKAGIVNGDFLDEIKEGVSCVARTFADEQIRICANHISSNTMPSAASKGDFVDVYTGDSEHVVNALMIDTINVIKEVGKLRFTNHDILIVAEKLDPARDYNYFDSLWENGLLGFIDSKDAKAKFYSGSSAETFNVPMQYEQYVFHPIVFDKIPSLEVSNHLISPA